MARNHRILIPFLVSLTACNIGPNTHAIFNGTSGRWVDLTYTLNDQSIFWPNARGFQLEEVAFGRQDAGYFYAAYNFTSAEHGGTHLDAPIHFAEGRATTDEIPLDRLIGPAAVIDVTANASPDYQISIRDIEAWEAAHGEIPEGGILLFRTGWGERWPDRAQYLGTATMGVAGIPDLHFPGIDPSAARWLLDNRVIDAVGIDTPSIDYGQSTIFESHQILYGANVPGFENVANLDELPESGGFVIALPTKIGGGSGGPLRIVGFVPQ